MKNINLNKFLVLLTICASTLSLTAQKVDLDPWRFAYAYTRLPAKPLPEAYQTYNIVVQSTGSTRNTMPDEQVASMVDLNGWKRVDVKGHVTIRIMLDNLIIEKSDVVERSEEKKDKDGKVTGRTYYYKPTVIYSFQSSGDARDYKGASVYANTFDSRSSRKTWTGTETMSSKEAYDYMNNNRTVIRDNLLRERIREAMNQMNASLNFDYGFTPVSGMDLVYLLDVKKHPENDKHQVVVKALKGDMAGMKADIPMDKIAETFKPLMVYLEESIKRYDKDEKGDRKMRYAALYAMGKISYWLDDPDATIKYGERLITNDFDTKDGKELIKWGTELKESMKKNNVTSRHFRIDLSAVEPPK